ncbi:hypothetical protein [Hymenobacter baengnokdamensis]|uniref:hypothetical protein n=1 Tax=Hymenobacter baengnokdamensis TaxID=2615203 RepID=UPI0012471699|nr:hypothetical protein [Hymenobacter baengnokdamensis]
MSQDTVALIGLLVVVVGLPLVLVVQEHFKAGKLSQPVVRFSCNGWQDINLLWTLLQAAFGLSLLLVAGAAIAKIGVNLMVLLLATLMLPIAWSQFAALRLYRTYWRHDGRALLVFYQEQKLATYVNQEFSLNFAASDVVCLSFHCSFRSRAASAQYSYTVIKLTKERTLLVTSLLCDYRSLCLLLPKAQTEVAEQRIAWLPATHT